MLETDFELIISEDHDVMWSELACVHEFLERSVSCFLEQHIVIERVYDHIIDLLLE